MSNTVDAAQDILAVLRGLAASERLPNLVAFVRAQERAVGLGVLRGMLGSPEKWQRDLAAGASAELGVDPLSEDEIPLAGEPVLALGFDEDSVPPVAPLAMPEDPAIPPVVFTCPTCGRPLTGSDCPACHTGSAPPARLPVPGRGFNRWVAGLGVVACLAAAWFTWPISTADQDRQMAELCRDQRLRLETLVRKFRVLSPGEELSPRFLSGRDFQDVLIDRSMLEGRLGCPRAPEQRVYRVGEGDDHTVFCGLHP